MAEKETRSVTRWDPFRELDLFERWPAFGEPMPSRIPHLLEDLFGSRWLATRPWSPALDITEDDGRYLVTVELPGMRREDVTVECQDNRLTIQGEKKSERKEKKENARYVERQYGAFRRSFTLPADADRDRVSAAFEEGVLTIEIPKTEEAKPRTVAIK